MRGTGNTSCHHNRFGLGRPHHRTNCGTTVISDQRYILHSRCFEHFSFRCSYGREVANLHVLDGSEAVLERKLFAPEEGETGRSLLDLDLSALRILFHNEPGVGAQNESLKKQNDVDILIPHSSISIGLQYSRELESQLLQTEEENVPRVCRGTRKKHVVCEQWSIGCSCKTIVCNFYFPNYAYYDNLLIN